MIPLPLIPAQLQVTPTNLFHRLIFLQVKPIQSILHQFRKTIARVSPPHSQHCNYHLLCPVLFRVKGPLMPHMVTQLSIPTQFHLQSQHHKALLYQQTALPLEDYQILQVIQVSLHLWLLHHLDKFWDQLKRPLTRLPLILQTAIRKPNQVSIQAR